LAKFLLIQVPVGADRQQYETYFDLSVEREVSFRNKAQQLLKTPERCFNRHPQQATIGRAARSTPHAGPIRAAIRSAAPFQEIFER
jgi:hypothetical protein